MNSLLRLALLTNLSLCAWTASALRASDDFPRPRDERLAVELFAEDPQIVTPTGIAVDARGRVFVAESHTHFRPDEYDGPPADRILVFEDTDGDGREDRRTVFHEGFTHVMDIEFHLDGSLYVATRMDIHRMRDTDGDDRADEVKPIIRMETTGTYPHNGLSGLAFDFRGDLHFGLGENLGHAYTLVGSDGIRLSGGGEGGSTYHVRADGANLRRVSTGWWNPFGMCVDAFGRVFGTDNDPGASPPCRLIQVLEGGDYGYEYRYGRTGLHPLITWTGDIPGTLPMIAGTGEAPCAVVAYESDALPDEYRGRLLVASWADHRIEHYPLTQAHDRGLVTTSRQVLLEADSEFRPVGLAVAPDGTVYVSDWVSSSYELHKQGRIWRIRPQRFAEQPRPASPLDAIQSKDQQVRESAARALAETIEGRRHLQELASGHQDPRVRVAALQALLAREDDALRAAYRASEDPLPAIRALAVRSLVARRVEPNQFDGQRQFTDPRQPAVVRAEAIRGLGAAVQHDALLAALNDGDPLLYHSAVEALAAGSRLREPAGHAVAVLLARRRAKQQPGDWLDGDALSEYLGADNPQLRFLAIKWVADEQLVEHRSQLLKVLEHEDLDYRSFLAVSAALERLDGNEPTDRPSSELLLDKIVEPRAPIALRRLALRMIDPEYRPLRLEHLLALAEHGDTEVRNEAVRTLGLHHNEARFERLAEIATDERQPHEVRASALAGLAPRADRHAELLLELAGHSQAALRDEALRCLVGVELDAQQRQRLLQLADGNPDVAEAVRRVLHSKTGDRPAADDLQAWLELVDGQGDRSAGERIFLGTKVGTCSRCHLVQGRGAAVGPDLSQMNRRLAAQGEQGRRWLLETILQPSREMAPQYTPWQILTVDGQQLIGLPRRKGGNAEAYLGIDGREFTLRKDRIQWHGEMDKSLMPDGLLEALTVQEMKDLLVYIAGAEG